MFSRESRNHIKDEVLKIQECTLVIIFCDFPSKMENLGFKENLEIPGNSAQSLITKRFEIFYLCTRDRD